MLALSIFFRLTLDCRKDTIGHKKMLLNARRIKRETDKPGIILLAIEDVSKG
jgi:hypothetical protein